MNQALTPLQKAFLALQDAEARIAELEGTRPAPIAVIGMACRAPGGVEDPASFWQLLSEGRDAISTVPQHRWDHDAFYHPDPDVPGCIATRFGGFINDVDQFDPEFFGIAPREAEGMDPQQRLVLEVCWEALEHAGRAPNGLEGTPTGVFVGAAANDYAYLQLKSGDPDLLDAHFASGIAHSVLSGRVSYLLGLQGPSLTIDTACSSSLVAVHMACQSLRAGDCKLALAGGVNLILSPDIFVALSRARMLSPDGRCRTFDAAANGFARGEGCAIIALKRLEDAEADNDRVLAVIRGCAINQDGASSGLTVPNGPAQEAVIRAALAQAGLSPAQVAYVEAHGTGTELGDPLEARALGAVFARDRTAPLLVGSVKTNIGHLEGAAGAIGLIKTILSLQHGVIPAHLHFCTPSPHIAWDDLRLRVPAQAMAFPEIGGRRIAGVSSFGFSGTNVHVIAEAPRPAPEPQPTPRRLWPLPISAPDAERLAALAGDCATALTPDMHLADVARTLALGRAHLRHRAVVQADTPDEARRGFEALARGERAPGLAQAQLDLRDPPRIAFLFTGQGAQYAGMGEGLYAAAPAFRDAFDRCDALLSPLLGRSIRDVIFAPEHAAILDQTGFAQPALFALEYSLAEFWRSLGVKPVAVLGHSVGEYVAACVAGALSVDGAAKLIAARARLMQSLPPGGAMAAVFAPEERVAMAIAPFAHDVSIAAVNGPAQAVISGAVPALEEACGALANAGIKTRRLNVSHAFHSPLMDPILDAFEAEVKTTSFAVPKVRVISNLTGNAIGASEIAQPSYWRKHLRAAVRFADGVAELKAMKVDLCLEIGPHPTLIAFAAAVFGGEGGPKLLASLRKDGDDWRQALDTAAQMHFAGVELDWRGINPEYNGRPVDMPLSRFKRSRCWFRAKASRTLAPSRQNWLGARQRSAAAQAVYETALSTRVPSWLGEHRVLGQIIVPGALLLEMMRHAGGATGLEDIQFVTALPVDDNTLIAQTVCSEDGEIFVASADLSEEASWRRHARARRASAMSVGSSLDLAAARASCGKAVDIQAFYDTYEPRGYALGPAFHTVRALWTGDCVALGEVEIAPDVAESAPQGVVHPLLLDGCLQAASGALPKSAADITFLPATIGSYHVWFSPGERATCHVRVEPAGAGFRANISIFDADGALAAKLNEVRFVPTSQAALAGRANHPNRALLQNLYEIVWRDLPVAMGAAQSGPLQKAFALISDRNAFCDALAHKLTGEGARVIRVHHGEMWSRTDDIITLNLKDKAALARMSAELDGVRTVVTGQALDIPNGGALEAALNFARLASTLHERPEPPRLFALTCGAQAVSANVVALEQAPIWGISRTLDVEAPELRATVVDLDPAHPKGDVDLVTAELFADSEEQQVALRAGRRLAARLVRSPAEAGFDRDRAAWRLEPETSGSFESFRRAPLSRRAPGAGEVEIETSAWGLNFRDVLNALDLYPGNPGPLGGECSGCVTAVGEGVSHVCIGDRVMAVAGGSFASHVIARGDLVQAIPPGMSDEEAAGFPIPWLTAAFCLDHVAKLKGSERVLIHAAAGGVGLAAVRLAQRAGAEVFATAGAPWKHELLAAAGVQHIYDSRTTAFADQILADTGGVGVDVVLNSLAGEMMDASFRVIAAGGRFVEIGKNGLKSASWVSGLNRDISYTVVDWGETAEQDPLLIRGLFERLVGEASTLPPLPRAVFDADEADEAFRVMAQARHAGKIVLRRIARPIEIRRDGTYLISGGLGGIGLETAQWLAARGAGKLVLFGRRGVTPEAEPAIARMKAAGAEIVAEAIDVGDRDALAGLLRRLRSEGPPLRGIIHSAGALANAALGNLDAARFETAFRARHDGAAALDDLTRIDPLDFFVLYSSIASVLGAAGQANYAAATAYMDALAHSRRRRGARALSVNWGAWGSVGMASGAGAYLAAQGLAAFTPEQGLDALAYLLPRGPQAAAAAIDWTAYVVSRRSGTSPFLREVVAEGMPALLPEIAKPSATQVRAEIERAPIGRRSSLILATIAAEAADVIGFAADREIDPDQPLGDLGLDSLMAVDLRNRLGRVLDYRFPATLLFDYPSIAGLAAYVGQTVFGLNGSADPQVAVAKDNEDALIASIEDLSDEAIDRMIAARHGGVA